MGMLRALAPVAVLAQEGFGDKSDSAAYLGQVMLKPWREQAGISRNRTCFRC